MATWDKSRATRARANLLREILTHSVKENPYDSEQLYEILDLCLSCKGCKSECPSNVDMAKVKAEFLQHYYDSHRIPVRTKVIAYIHKINRLGALLPSLFNFFVQNGIISGPVKKALGFAQKRQIPSLSKITLHKWIKKHPDRLISQSNDTSRTVNLFIDEFTNYNESDIGIKAIGLLVRLGYNVNCPETGISGRTFISKGLLRTARKTARKNIEALQGVVSGQNPLLGIEPSAVLSFRDEYPDLAGEDLKHTALDLANHVFLVEEFLVQELEKGKISQDLFTSESKQILYHGHCQQKAIASTSPTIQMLSLPENYVVEEIPSGCCGMAGSFGYEKEHYDLSMKVGELVLFPEIRKHRNGVILSASGTSCRQQIMDGTGRQALHPIEILHDALV